jgi:hypothetical protein
MRPWLIVIALLLITFSAWWYFQGYSEEIAVALGYAPPSDTRAGGGSPGIRTWLPMAFDIFNSVVGVIGLVVGIIGLRR